MEEESEVKYKAAFVGIQNKQPVKPNMNPHVGTDAEAIIKKPTYLLSAYSK